MQDGMDFSIIVFIILAAFVGWRLYNVLGTRPDREAPRPLTKKIKLPGAQVEPDEVYNLAAQSHVRVSFEEPEHTADTTGTGTIRMLEAVRLSGIQTRFYQASSSEMFGATPPPQNEETPFYPRSPYGASKVYSHWITKNYREAYEANRLISRGLIHPTLSKTFPLEGAGQAAYEVHRNAHQGKVGVLCLSPEEGLGVRDQEMRERHLPAITRFAGA